MKRMTVSDLPFAPVPGTEEWRLLYSLNDCCQRFGYAEVLEAAGRLKAEHEKHCVRQQLAEGMS